MESLSIEKKSRSGWTVCMSGNGQTNMKIAKKKNKITPKANTTKLSFKQYIIETLCFILPGWRIRIRQEFVASNRRQVGRGSDLRHHRRRVPGHLRSHHLRRQRHLHRQIARSHHFLLRPWHGFPTRRVRLERVNEQRT